MTRSSCVTATVLLLTMAGAARPHSQDAAPAAAASSLTQVNIPGFGDRYNSISWSMLWWRGRLYVGTSRAAFCLRVLGWHDAYPPSDPDVECTPDRADLPLAAEIWRYAPDPGGWELVYRAPTDLPYPGRPGKFIARDIGYRDMIAFREPDGTEALYVSGVSARFLPGALPPPRLLRSTDGVTFEPVPQDRGTVLGDLDANNFRSLAVFRDKLYVTAGSIWGDGPLYESANPAAGNNTFRLVTPPGMRVFSIEVFDNQLYVGTTDVAGGWGIYRTTGLGSAPYTFVPVVTGAAHHPGEPSLPTSVISFETFNGSLYAGTDGLGDVVRVHADDTWDLIVGAPRATPAGFRVPLSGLGGGFNWSGNVLIWRMAVHDGALFIGTFDSSSFLKENLVLGPILRPHMGAKMYATRDGRFFRVLAYNSFDGDFLNYGIRTFASTPYGLFIGTANEWYGTEVWRLVTQ